VGTIHGGDARNVVPDRVVVQAMARSTEEPRLQQQLDAMQKALRTAADKHGADLQVEVTRMYSAYTAGPGHAAYDAAARAYTQLGIPLNNRPSTGGTDANNFNAAGIPAVALSTGMMAEHSPGEHIAIQDLFDATRAALCMVLNAADHAS
jgi:tripeptide aminopeptidase